MTYEALIEAVLEFLKFAKEFTHKHHYQFLAFLGIAYTYFTTKNFGALLIYEGKVLQLFNKVKSEL